MGVNEYLYSPVTKRLRDRVGSVERTFSEFGELSELGNSWTNLQLRKVQLPLIKFRQRFLRLITSNDSIVWCVVGGGILGRV